jgi:hypothetical protein
VAEAIARLADAAVTVLDIYGSLFSASAWTLERLLPTPGQRSALVLRLRGRDHLDAAFLRCGASMPPVSRPPLGGCTSLGSEPRQRTS